MPVVYLILITFGAAGLFLALPGRGRSFGRIGLLVLLGLVAACIALLLPRLGGLGDRVAFALLSGIGLFGAIRVITHPRPVYSALFFIVLIVSMGGLLVLMNASFVASALLIIYAGAILVTYLFVIMLAQQGTETAPYDATAREPFWGVLAGFLVLGTLTGHVLSGDAANELAAPAVGILGTVGDVRPVGELLLTEYVVGVQLAGVLLLAAMVGAVAIAKRQAALSEETN